MQDLASEFSIPPDPYSGGDPLPHPIPSPTFGRARGASAPVLRPKLWSPQLFSCGCAPVNPYFGARRQNETEMFSESRRNESVDRSSFSCCTMPDAVPYDTCWT